MNKAKKRVPIEKIILFTIAIVGIISVIAIAPGIGPVLKLFGLGRSSYDKSNVNRAIKRIKEKGYISYISRNGKKYIHLTQKGKDRLSRYELQGGVNSLGKERKQDGKWHIVIFDIKEKRKVTRDKLRYQLVMAGFVKLQNSVWVSPYVADEFVALLKADNHIGKDVIYIRADYIENEALLKKLF